MVGSSRSMSATAQGETGTFMSSDKNPPRVTGCVAELGMACRELTTCEIASDGGAVRLYFLDHAGDTAFLELPFEQAQSVAMTLPRLLTTALRTRTGNSDARYVFPTTEWALELGDAPGTILLTLRTHGGFEASFGLGFDMARNIGTALTATFGSALQAMPDEAKRH